MEKFKTLKLYYKIFRDNAWNNMFENLVLSLVFTALLYLLWRFVEWFK